MRPVKTVLATAAAAGALAPSLRAAAPHAATVPDRHYYQWDCERVGNLVVEDVPERGGVRGNVYYYEWDCERVGNLGVQSGWWSSWECISQYNYWFLYAD